MKKFADTARRLLSIVLNLFIVWAEPIALPMSWDWGKEQMFIFYTEDYRQGTAALDAHPQVYRHLLPDHDLSHGGVRAGPHV